MKKAAIILLLVLATGCTEKYTKPAQKEAPVPPPAQEEEAAVTAPVEEVVVEEQITPPARQEVTETAMSIEEQAKSVFRDILFDYDKYDIEDNARPVLDSVAEFLDNNRDANIVVEGHCDARGTNEYNLALGEKRAKAARAYLSSRGVSTDRMITITFGEEKPVCMEQTEACWQQNRRAHFVLVRAGR